MSKEMGKKVDLKKVQETLSFLLKPESSFFSVVIVYSIAIGLLTLAVPLAVQTLINSIAHIGSTRAVVILAIVLFSILFISGVLSVLRTRVMEYYERRVYARLTSDLGLRTIMAPHSYFEGRHNTSVMQRYFDITKEYSFFDDRWFRSGTTNTGGVYASIFLSPHISRLKRYSNSFDVFGMENVEPWGKTHGYRTFYSQISYRKMAA